MTTIVVARKGSRVAIAADTLAKYGDGMEPAELVATHEKLLAVDDAWLAPTGPASAQLVLENYFKRFGRKRSFSSVEGIFETFLDMQGTLKEHYFLNPKEDERDPFESMQMEVLIASPGGIFGVYPLRSVQEFTRFYAFGSGAEYALGAMRTVWDDAQDPEQVAEVGLTAAAAFDDSTGLPITLRAIELGG